ncbi:MAG: hypothetical protein M1482_11645 [Chloroflexi bacterium]|nr:hypothetical protein [Chloroflexota bacterium]
MSTASLLTEASKRLRRLSPERLRVANDFLAYLQEREETDATQELLNIPGFDTAFERAVSQVKRGKVVRFAKIRRDV